MSATFTTMYKNFMLLYSTNSNICHWQNLLQDGIKKQKTNKQTNKQTNKRPNKQKNKREKQEKTDKQAIKETKKQIKTNK